MRAIRHGTAAGTKLAVVLLGIVALIALPGSSGCSRKTPQEAKKELEKLKKKEKPKRDFDGPKIFVEPNETAATDPANKEGLAVIRAIKPGHWTGMLVETKANNFDFSGELSLAAVDSQSNPVDLQNSPFHLVMSRAAALPRGQQKTLESLFFAPVSGHPGTWLSDRLRSKQQGDYPLQTEPLTHMPPYQYFMFVLARDPNRYRYLKVLNCVHVPLDAQTLGADEALYYRMLFARPVQPIALPTQSLCWTSIAMIVWDDVLPSLLTPEQQLAMLDWLHWGGTLLISGPGTLDSLRGTFLEPYLPASSAETASLGPEALAEMDAHWTVRGGGRPPAPLKPVKPWSGIKLARHAEATFIPGTGELVAERRVGRGRVVATAFRMHEQELIRWPSFDSFFNACILTHGQRAFDAHGGFHFVDAQEQRHHYDRITGLRIFTRNARDPRELPTPEAQKGCARIWRV